MTTRWFRGLLVVGTPLALLLVPRLGGQQLVSRLLEVLLGLLVVGVLSRRPDRALLLLLAFLPVQSLVLALLLAGGAPVALIRVLALTKEAVVAALVLAAIRTGQRRAWDLLDRLVLGYVALVSLYLVVPFVLPGVFVSIPFSIRAVAWRYDALFAVSFLAARRIAWPEGFVRRAAVVATAVGVASSLCAMIEFFSPSTWSRFLTQVAHIRIYRAVIEHNLTRATDGLDHSVLAGHDVIRVGGAALSPLQLGFVLIVPLALSIERLGSVRGRLLLASVTGLLSGALLATLTRSAILGGLLAAVVIVRLGAVRARPGRVQLVLGIAVLAAVLAPLAGSSNVAERAASSFTGDQSAQGHQARSFEAYQALLHEPFGRGLGTNPATGQRFRVQRQLDSENAYLQVGVELGLLTMVVFVAMFVVLLLALRRRALVEGSEFGFTTALLAAGVGLGFIGLFLHVWLDLGTALGFWSLAGLALASSTATSEADAPAAVTAPVRVALGRA